MKFDEISELVRKICKGLISLKGRGAQSRPAPHLDISIFPQDGDFPELET